MKNVLKKTFKKCWKVENSLCAKKPLDGLEFAVQ